MAVELPELMVSDAAAWRAWLQEHCAQPDGVWLVLAKKGNTSPTSLRYDEALLEALCFGWIDGQTGRRDEVSYRQRFTPRRPRSPWSARNVGHVERLMEEGRMAPSGLAAVEQARKDGRWEKAYPGAADMPVPDDLLAALDRMPTARAAFDGLSGQNRYAILYRLHQVSARNRAGRIRDYVEMLARGGTLHPQRSSKPD